MKMNIHFKIEYEYEIYMHSHLILNTTLGNEVKLRNEMEG